MDYDNLNIEEAKQLLKEIEITRNKVLEKQRNYQRNYIKSKPNFREKNTLRSRRKYWRDIKEHLLLKKYCENTLSKKNQDRLEYSVMVLKEIEEGLKKFET